MVFTYMQQDGYCFKVAGENIGLSTYSDDVGHQPHRDGLHGIRRATAPTSWATWARMGVGAYKAADGRKLYTVLFSIPCGVTVPRPVPTPPPVATRARLRPRPRRPSRRRSRPPSRPQADPDRRPATPTPTPTPTATPTATPTPLHDPDGHRRGRAGRPRPTGSPATERAASLRVREKPAPAGPLDSLFHWLFGGIFGW